MLPPPMNVVAMVEESYPFVRSRAPKIAVPTRTSVAPSRIASSRSADIPIDSVSTGSPEVLQASRHERNTRNCARLRAAGARISKVASVVPARHVVVAGVSNWGAYGIVVELARLSRRPLLHTAEEERQMVRACVAAGAVDGITRKREATVDALPLEAHAGMVELMRLIQDSTPHGGKAPHGGKTR
jgi:hypothetical protein